MTAALMLLPLILTALDEILIRQRHSAVWSGVLLGLLVFGQFFLSTELLAITAVVAVVGVVVLAVGALLSDRSALRRLAPHAAVGLAVGLGVGAALLAWPVWFALDGPAHLSGLVWPNVNVLGGFIPSSFVGTGYPHGNASSCLWAATTGASLPSGGLSRAGASWRCSLAGTAAFWRDRRLWFFGFVLVVCGVSSLGEPARPVGAGPALRPRARARERDPAALHGDRFPGSSRDAGHHPRPRLRVGAGLAGRLWRPARLRRRARADGDDLRRAPALHHAPGDPAPLVHRSGPDAAARAGSCCRIRRRSPGSSPPWPGRRSTACTTARPVVAGRRGWRVGPARRSRASRSSASSTSGSGLPDPPGTPAQYAAVRHALAVWQVNTVVIATDPAVPRGRSRAATPTYAAAFMTAALGRLPDDPGGGLGLERRAGSASRRPLHRQGRDPGEVRGRRRGQVRTFRREHAGGEMCQFQRCRMRHEGRR